MRLHEVISFLKSMPKDGLPKYRVAVVRNITVEFCALYLRHGCAQLGLDCVVSMGEHDNAIQEAMTPGSHLYAEKPDLILVCLGADPLAERLVHEFNALSPEDVASEMDRVLDQFRAVLGAIRQRAETPVLVHGLESPTRPALGILDSQTDSGQLGAFREMNRRLRELAASHAACHVLDLDLLRLRTGADQFFDARFWHMGMAPFSAAGAEVLGREYLKFIRALTGRAKKCLVLDCDNTLWGGILGEDGFDRIAMGHDYPGSAYRDVQRVCLELNRRGVLLALCSKNNEADVLHVLDTHPDMLIRREHLACLRVNWDDKASNLAAIASLLNIGLDSLVFADDSDFEVNLVRQALPQVTVLHFSGSPERFAGLLTEDGLFDSLRLTAEDRRRPAMYKAEAARREAATQFSTQNLDEYLGSLEMEAAIVPVDSFTLPRASQMTLRTNQFNLTTRRHNEAELEEFLHGGGDILTISLKDRFGDFGIVGLAILLYKGADCLLESFLLSCRALGRGVEDALLCACIQRAAERGAQRMVGCYLPTPKNEQVRAFFPSRGFAPLRDLPEGGAEYTRDLTPFPPPLHIRSHSGAASA